MAVHTCANCQYAGSYDSQVIREPGLAMSYHLVAWHFPLFYRGLALPLALVLALAVRLLLVEHCWALGVRMSGRCL